MNKCLIILTSVSPNVKGESFINNELAFHSQNFNKVIVIAIEKIKEEIVNNKYADNIDVHEASADSGKESKLIDAFKGLLNIFRHNDALTADKIKIGKSLSKLVFANYFEMRAKRNYDACTDILNKYDFSQFDEVVVYSYWFFLACRVGVEIKNYLKKSGVKTSFVSRGHGYDIYNYANKLNYLPERDFLAGNVDLIYPCSKSGETYLKKEIPQYADKIKCSYLGSFDHGLSGYSSLFHIVTCSHTMAVKRLDKLVDALSLLKDYPVEIYWTHIGDGVLQNEIKTRAQEKLGFMNCEFLGRMDNAQVMEYYRTHPVSLFVNVSASEGLPVSIMEAISFGIPVLATDVGGTHEIVCDGFNGKLISKDFTDKDFVDALLSVYNLDENEYKTMRKNARQFWEKNFNAEKNYPEFSETIANLDKIKTAH